MSSIDVGIRSVRSTDVRRSASWLGWGLVTMIVGQTIALLAAIGGGSWGIVWFGAFVGIVGLWVSAYGVYLMARDVDVAATVAAESLARIESDAFGRGGAREGSSGDPGDHGPPSIA